MGRMHGPLGTDCGYSLTHNWLDSCEAAFMIGAAGGVIGTVVALVAGIMLGHFLYDLHKRRG